MIEGTLKNGFKFHLDDNIFDDFELVDTFVKEIGWRF